MASFLFQNGSVYYEKDDQRGVLPLDVFKASPLVRTTDAIVFFTDVDARRSVAPDSDAAKRDQMFGSLFANDVLVVAERTKGNTYQVFGAKSSVIRDIYAVFGKENIKLLVPYSVGIRSFIIDRGVVPPGKAAVVLDDLGDKYILTIFHGLEVSESREIVHMDPQKVVEEILRSQKEFESRMARDAQTPDFYFVSNSKEVCDSASVSGLYSVDAIAFIDSLMPVFKARIPMNDFHFSLPEDVVRLRQMKELKKNFWVYVGAGSVVLVGVAYFLGGAIWYGSLSGRVTELAVKETHLQSEINNEMAMKYRDIIRHSPKADLLMVVDSFRENVPFGFQIEYVSLKDASNKWDIQGVVVADRKLLSDFGKTGIFQTRTIENIFVRNLPAQKVTTVLKKGE